MTPAEPARIAIASTYDGLVDALRTRKAQLGITDEELEKQSGLTAGHVGKLLGAAQSKALGPISLGLMLQTLGCELWLVANPESEKRITSLAQKRIRPVPRTWRLSLPAAKRLFPRMFQNLGRRGGRARAKKLSPERRKEIARNAGIASGLMRQHHTKGPMPNGKAKRDG